MSWSWSCSDTDSAGCTYRFRVDQSPTTIPSGGYSTTSSTTKTGAGGTYYLHVQARDRAGNESAVGHFSGVIEPGGFAITGNVKFDWVPAVTTSSGNRTVGKLDYAAEQQLPARRVRVEAIDSVNSSVVASTSTDDSGNYRIDVPAGRSVKVRVHARMVATGYLPDGIAGSPESCSGSSWDVRVVDNTNSRAGYALTSSSVYSAAASNQNFTPAIARSGGVYTDRAAAPFALLDTILREIELVCQADASIAMPLVLVHWSVNNEAISGTKSQGQISTSHYTRENVSGIGSSVPVIYILGKEDNDTDEYDDHVVAHEFGHYLEDNLYRSDSIGGGHFLGEMIDPRVAFGEGFGNAISAMTFDDSVYIDTAGEDQIGGFAIDVNVDPGSSSTPSSIYRSVYSEFAVQHVLWKLFKNRGNFDRIHTVLAQDHRTTAALTSMHSFAAYYRARFGTEDGLFNLWSTTLFSPWNALCVGSCPTSGSSGTRDLFDLDQDLGARYASSLRYPAYQGASFPEAFWNLYQPIPDSSEHSQTKREYSDSDGNEMGLNRWYHYRNTGATKSVTVSVPSIPGGCSRDALDLYVLQGGDIVKQDESQSGCPTVTFTAETGVDYVVVVSAWEGEVSSFEVRVQ